MLQLLSYFIDAKAPMYGGKSGFVSKSVTSISKGDTANTSYLQLPNHLGTHVDFPRHFFNKGQTLQDYPLDFWFFEGKKVEILEIENNNDQLIINPENIKTKKLNKDAEIILLKTDFGQYRNKEKYWNSNPGISIKLVAWMKENYKKIGVFGIDTISVSSFQHRELGRKVHKKLLDPINPILIIEDMDLSKISQASIFNYLWISPLMLKDIDGCPCTIVADVK